MKLSTLVILSGVLAILLILMATTAHAGSIFTAADYKSALKQQRAAFKELGLDVAESYPYFAYRQVTGTCSNCKKNQCCSKYGWCGITHEYCDSICAKIKQG